jgi:hypothetical protein
VIAVSSASLQISPDIGSQENLGCVHYWIIDIPAGPVSRGKCRLCGESREFRNYLETASGWDDDRITSQASAAGRSSLIQLVGLGVEHEEEY